MLDDDTFQGKTREEFAFSAAVAGACLLGLVAILLGSVVWGAFR